MGKWSRRGDLNPLKPEDRRDRLIALGPEALADALIALGSRDDRAAAVIERLTATEKENLRRFKAKLSGLKRQRKFIDWREAPLLARKLEEMLANLRAGVEDPRSGVELMAAFFESDRSVFDRCDDSSGMVGEVFRHDARELFIDYATRVQDKKWLGEFLSKLYWQDEYGVRAEVLEAAHEFLPAEILQEMAAEMWRLAQTTEPGIDHYHSLRGVQSLARQLKDADLFEKAAVALAPKKPLAVCLEIARVHLECGDAGRALSWMEAAPSDNPAFEGDRDVLLLAVYGQLGDEGKAADTAWRIFRNHRSAVSLNTLLEVVGEEKRQWIIEQQVHEVEAQERLDLAAARFMLEMEHAGDAETYIVTRADQLNGGLYELLSPLAKAMEKEELSLGATVIYRALLESILKRAISKYYHHGVRYLKKLDSLAPQIGNWHGLAPHEVYREGLLEAHGRKTSFWAKYGL